MIKAIIFDVDGVLVDSKNANVAFYQTLLTKAGYPSPPRKAVLENFHLTAWQTIEKLTGLHDQKEIKRIWSLIEEASARSPELYEFPENLEQMLEDLHRQYKLGIVTGRVRYGVDEIFTLREIRHLFDAVITFEDYTNPKPHPESLLLALNRLGISSKEALYIGDSPTDIEAANAAGVKSIYLNRKPHDDATANVTGFDALRASIEQIADL